MKNFVLFIILSVAISALTACENNSQANKSPEGEQTENSTSKDSEIPKVDDGLPFPPEAIANAEIELLNGEKFKIADNKGKVILVNLWAIWCIPCLKEMPHLNEMQEKYGDKDFVLLGLNTGDDLSEKESVENIEKFVAKQNLNYKIGWSDKNLSGEFYKLGQMNGIPQTFLINREGKLMGIFQGGGAEVIAKMKETVDKLMDE